MIYSRFLGIKEIIYVADMYIPTNEIMYIRGYTYTYEQNYIHTPAKKEIIYIRGYAYTYQRNYVHMRVCIYP